MSGRQQSTSSSEDVRMPLLTAGEVHSTVSAAGSVETLPVMHSSKANTLSGRASASAPANAQPTHASPARVEVGDNRPRHAAASPVTRWRSRKNPLPNPFAGSEDSYSNTGASDDGPTSRPVLRRYYSRSPRRGADSTFSGDSVDPVLEKKLQRGAHATVHLAQAHNQRRRVIDTLRQGHDPLRQRMQTALSMDEMQSRLFEVNDILPFLETLPEDGPLRDSLEAATSVQKEIAVVHFASGSTTTAGESSDDMNTEAVATPAPLDLSLGHVNAHASRLGRKTAAVGGNGSMRKRWTTLDWMRFIRYAVLILYELACTAYAGWHIYRSMHGEPRILKYDVWVAIWAILGATTIPFIWLLVLGIDGVVYFVERTLSAVGAEHTTFLLMGLSTSLRTLVAAFVIYIECSVLLYRAGGLHGVHTPAPVKVMYLLSLCAFIFAGVELVRNLGCRVLSLRVHAKKLLTKVSETVSKEQCLNKLMCKPSPELLRKCSKRIDVLAERRGVPREMATHYLSMLYLLSLASDLQGKKLSFTDQIARLVKVFDNIDEDQCKEHAAYAAEFLWWTFKSDAPTEDGAIDKLTLEDVKSFIQDDTVAEFVFRLFDVDGDGYVVEEELSARMWEMYRERQNLAKTLRDTDTVIQTLSALVGGLAHATAAFVYLYIFGVDVMHIVLSLSSLTLGLAFIFGASLKTIYESFVYLFFVHPYEVGDLIIFENMSHRVSTFGLVSTCLCRYDGSVVWVPNPVLMGSNLVNVTASQNARQRLNFEVNSRCVTPEIMEDLELRLTDLVQAPENSAYYNPEYQPFVSVVGVRNNLSYELQVCLELADNAEDYVWYSNVNSRTFFTIGEWLADHDIIHSSSVAMINGAPMQGALHSAL